MKKLILGVAIAFAAVMANAATYNWQMSFFASPDGENPLVATVYAFDANVYAYSVISAALTTTGASALDNALGHNDIDGDGLALVSGSGLTDNGSTVTAPTASMYAIIIGEANDKTYFQAVDFDPVVITDSIVAGEAPFALEYVGTGAIGGEGWTEVVPEPTSGLLMLIGLAGLALKRKRM